LVSYSVLLGLLAAMAVRVDADQPDAAPQILVLQNGQVLRGQVSLHGDSYLVTLPYGEIRVPIENVEHVCGTLEEAFRLKQNTIRFGSARQHLQLADWCLDHGLHEHARQELALATTLEPRHHLAAVIADRLAATTQKGIVVGEEATIQQPATDAKQLDALVRQLPPGTVESFTNTIQPLLVNSCSARACHGSMASNDFQLRRFPHGQKPRRRLTLRNLEAVMRWVDQDDPAASRLLYAATHPHGPAKRSPLLSEPAQQKLLEWLGRLGTTRSSAQLAGQGVATETDTASFVLPHKSLHNPADAGVIPISTANPPSGDATSANRYRPQDPFDPEIFNRRYHVP
jgi:hypothetical protein